MRTNYVRNRSMHCDGRTLARLRQELGISQQDLAQKAKLSKTTIERAERGKALDYQSIHEIAAVLNVGIGALVMPEEEAGLEASLIPLRGVDEARELVELILHCNRCDFDLLDQPAANRLQEAIGVIRRLETFFPGHPDVAPVHDRWRRSQAERLIGQEDVRSCLAELATMDLHLLAGEYRALLPEDERQGYIEAYVDYLEFADLGATKPDEWSRVGILRIAKAERRQYCLKVDDLWTE